MTDSVGKQLYCRKLKRSYQSLDTAFEHQHQQQQQQQQRHSRGYSNKPKCKFSIGTDDEENTSYHDENEYYDDDEDVENFKEFRKRRAGSKSSSGWRSIRAVVAYYCSLRKIKRNGAF